MFRWSMSSMLMVALLCPAAGVFAQDAPAGDPAAEAERAAEQEIQLREMMAERAAEQAARSKEMELQLREMAGRARELAAVRAEIAVDGAGNPGVFRIAGRARATEKAAWLGVSTSKVPAALRQHLQLQNRYIGLLVERVEPESPAAQAGLEQFDIIEKLDDQWIVNGEQFSVVLRMRQPGQEVNLSIIRKGQPQQITATLVEKDVPVLGMAEFEFMDVAGAAAMGGGGMNWVNVAPEGRVVIRDPAGFEPFMQFRRLNDMQNSQVTLKDEQHTLKLTTNKGQRQLVASDADGVVIFEGPVNTDEEQAAIPDEIREKVNTMLQSPEVPEVPAVPLAPAAPAGRGARE